MKNKITWFSNLKIMSKVQYIFAVSMAVTILLCTLFFISVTRLKLTRTYADKNEDMINSVEKSYQSVIDNVNSISKLVMYNDKLINYLRQDQETEQNSENAESEEEYTESEEKYAESEEEYAESEEEYVESEEDAESGGKKEPEKVTDDEARNELYRVTNSFDGRYTVFVLKKFYKKEEKTPRMDDAPEIPLKNVQDYAYVNTSIGIMRANEEYLFSEDWYGRAEKKMGGFIIMPDNEKEFAFNTNIRTISFTRVINDIDTQKPIGLLVINIPVSELAETYENFASDDSIFAYFYQNKELETIPLACNCGKDVFDTIIERSPSLRSEDVYSTVSHGRVISGRRLTDTGMYVLCSSRISFFDGISGEMIVQIIGIALLILLMLHFISKNINKHITIPVTELSEIMKKVKSTDPVLVKDVIPVDESSDEINNLRICYNDMTLRIGKLHEEVLKQENQTHQAEMRVIQEQMNPHFLYNTLETIGCMAYQNTPDEVYDAIETLGTFYRQCLNKGGGATISLDGELLIVEKYVKIMQLRNDTEFNVEYDIEKGLGAVLVPKLILQPFVENSIQHGIIPKGEPGLITIRAYSENSRIHIKVRDNGVGMSAEKVEELNTDKDKISFGIRGTIARIRSFYDEEHQKGYVNVSSRLHEYCEVDINIPRQLTNNQG